MGPELVRRCFVLSDLLLEYAADDAMVLPAQFPGDFLVEDLADF